MTTTVRVISSRSLRRKTFLYSLGIQIKKIKEAEAKVSNLKLPKTPSFLYTYMLYLECRRIIDTKIVFCKKKLNWYVNSKETKVKPLFSFGSSKECKEIKRSIK